MRVHVLSAHGVTHCTWAGQRLTWEGPTQPAGGFPATTTAGQLKSLCTADLAATQQARPAFPSSPGSRGPGKTKPALPLGYCVDSGDTGGTPALPPASEGQHHPSLVMATPFKANAEGPRCLSPRPSALGLGRSGRSARHQRCPAFTLEHVTGP